MGKVKAKDLKPGDWIEVNGRAVRVNEAFLREGRLCVVHDSQKLICVRDLDVFQPDAEFEKAEEPRTIWDLTWLVDHEEEDENTHR